MAWWGSRISTAGATGPAGTLTANDNAILNRNGALSASGSALQQMTAFTRNGTYTPAGPLKNAVSIFGTKLGFSH